MKVLRFFAIVGGFLLGAIFVIMAMGLCNPAAYQLDFVTSGVLTLAFASFYSIWEYPVVTLVTGVMLAISTAFTTKILFQKQRSALAWCIGAAGYLLFLFMAFLGWQIYQFFSRSLLLDV